MKKMQYFSYLGSTLFIIMISTNNSCEIFPTCFELKADRSLHRAGLLNNFRAAHEPFIYEIIPEPTREGLDKVLISTSEQLTEKELKALKTRLNNPKKLLILDIRYDRHGFVNGEPVQFHPGPINKHAFDNDEQSLSQQIKLCDTMYLTDRHVRDMSSKGLLIDVERVNIEPDLVRALGYDYERMPFDVSKPLDPTFIDTFVALIDTQSSDAWIHIHDIDGLMSTSLLFVMADMLKNSTHVRYDDIILRHVAFGGIDFSLKRHAPLKQFLKQFYRYAREHAVKPMLTWSAWLKNNN